MARLQHFFSAHCLAAHALLLAAVPSAHAERAPERVVIVELCTAQAGPERVEAMLTNPVEKLLIALPGVATMNSVTGHGGARFEIALKGGASEDDAASVAQALDRSDAGQRATILSRSVQLGQALPHEQAFGHAVCTEAKRR